MLAVDFFFAGMGGGMLVIAAIVELFLGSQMTLLGNIIGPLCMCVGSGFLILELGRPLQAWRVFMNPKAILTFGAWMMTIAIVAGFIYASFDMNLEVIFWRDWVALRKLLAVVILFTGLIVATYPGVLLARHKGRPFWVGPGMMGLFLLSSLVTGAAAHFLSGVIMTTPALRVQMSLPAIMAALLFAQLILWIGYLWIKRTGTTTYEAKAAERWISGDYAPNFKLFITVGTLAPLILALIPNAFFQAIAALLLLAGGVIMRILVVYSGQQRTYMPGEQLYRSRLPEGDEKFLKKAWL